MSAERREPRALPIGALDSALWDALEKLAPADKAVADFLDEHIDTIDAYHELTKHRADMYYGIKNTEKAIRDLGYVVVRPDNGTVPKDASVLGDYTFGTYQDEQAARERRNET